MTESALDILTSSQILEHVQYNGDVFSQKDLIAALRDLYQQIPGVCPCPSCAENAPWNWKRNEEGFAFPDLNKPTFVLPDAAQALCPLYAAIMRTLSPVGQGQVMPCAIKTQKARGIRALANYGMRVPAHHIYSLPLDPTSRANITNLQWFVRPCPTHARHGFVDSRIIRTREDLDALEQETLAADPNAELVAMEPIPAEFSAVLTRKAITFGRGTDGATQGHNTLTLPLQHVALDKGLLKAAGIVDEPYFELLYLSPKDYRIVQLRNGVTPTGSTSGNWVPNDTTVTGIIQPCEDALAFEKQAAEAPEGTILHHPSGSLLSHYSQHAMLRGMPIIFDTEAPALGTALQATVDKQPPMELKEIIRGLYFGLTRDITTQQKETAKVMLLSVHNAMAFVTSQAGAWLFGFSVGNLLRLSTAAILGELRHANRRNRKTRDEVYLGTLGGFAQFKKTTRKRTTAVEAFSKKTWGSGFGGQAWAQCSERTIYLEQTILQFMTEPSEEHAKELIGAAHNVVNAAHNNGPFLSKFVSVSYFDFAAHGNIDFTISTAAMGYQFIRESKPDLLPESIMKWIRARHRNIRKAQKPPLKIVALQFAMRASDTVFHFQYRYESAPSYQSFEISRDLLSPEELGFLNTIRKVKAPAAPSMAGSTTRYWTLDFDCLPESLQKRLQPEMEIAYAQTA